MTTAKSTLVGCCRIVEADLWDRDFLDLCGPAKLVVGSQGHGELSFGAVQVGLDITYNHDDIAFTWCGFDEMDEVQGYGAAELQNDGSLVISFSYHLGDDATVLKATRSLLQQPVRSTSSRSASGSCNEISTFAVQETAITDVSELLAIVSFDDGPLTRQPAL